MKITICLLPLTLFFSAALNGQYFGPFQNDRYFENSIIYSTGNSNEHCTLTTAVIAAELDEILESDGPFTVFAPSDSAFQKISEDRIQELLQPKNKHELQSLLTYHMIAGRITAAKILKAMCRGGGTASFTTIQGNILTATIDGIDIVLSDKFGNKAKITTADEDRCNGVIHVIDSVIMP